MIDLHCHLLPGIDDGAADWTEAAAMAERYVEDGVVCVAATPHMMPDGPFANRASAVLSLVDEARRRFGEAGITLEIVAGGELYASEELIRGIDDGSLLTYGGMGRYALVEMPAAEIPPFIEEVWFALQVRGITPILAHPERNLAVAADPERLIPWIERGVALQVNARSILGASGSGTRRVAETLLLRRMAHLVASDAHGARRRPPGLSEARARVEELVDGEYAATLVSGNPRKVIAGEPIERWEPAPPPKRGILSRLFGGRRGA